MKPPVLTREQQLSHLTKAHKARAVRKQLKFDITDQKITLHQILIMAKLDPIIANTKTISIIKALPGVGDYKADLIMRYCKINHKTRLGGLGVRQKRKLLHLERTNKFETISLEIKA